MLEEDGGLALVVSVVEHQQQVEHRLAQVGPVPVAPYLELLQQVRVVGIFNELALWRCSQKLLMFLVVGCRKVRCMLVSALVESCVKQGDGLVGKAALLFAAMVAGATVLTLAVSHVTHLHVGLLLGLLRARQAFDTEI